MNSKCLIIVTNYPGGGSKEAHRFVHVRNLFYVSSGLDITVLSFSAKHDYKYEGIKVITLDTYKSGNEKYELLISHQPNIRQHYRFIKKYGKKFNKYMLFFHGHEVLRFKTTYPEPYTYVSKTPLKNLLRDFYDQFKLAVWHKFIPQIINKSMLVFVSNWMLEEFLRSTKLTPDDLLTNYSITYNCVGKLFQDTEYDFKSIKDYDFVTIRSNLDGSKYCIDFVTELAKNNPKSKFLVIGKGKFYSYNTKPDNVIWENRVLNHEEIIKVLQKSRCALMPTRTDAQGLMMCEMATLGMPVITSDLPVCHEALDLFKNVSMIKNENAGVDLESICKKLEEKMPYKKQDCYFNTNTSLHEVHIIKSMISK